MFRMRPAGVIRSIFGDVLHFALPRGCAACRSLVESNHFLCESCRESFETQANSPACAKCASPAPENGAPCGRCGGRGLRPFATISRVGVHENVLRELVHTFKYLHRWQLADRFAEILLSRESVRTMLRDDAVLVPVPMHWRKRLSRGFNQAEVLAGSLASRTGAKVEPALRRRKAAPSQTAYHSRAARVRNVKDAFELIDADAVAGRHVVLVDDVITSGATLRSAARTLWPAKPKRFDAIVIAAANPTRTLVPML